MNASPTILSSIGRTPLVPLRRLTSPGHAKVYCKCEYLNPSGSIKDRFVYYALEEALKNGEIAPGGTIVENTSGNTGAALALWAAVRGVHCIFTIPDKMSSEKINTLKAMGAEVVVCPTNVPAESPDSYYETAKRLAKERDAYYLNQYHNKKNIEAHYSTTGPNIWEQTGGQFDYFVAGLGTGGTMSGAGRYLKEKKPEIQNIGVDPIGSVFYSLFKTGKADTPHVYKVEGIGEDMPCGALDLSVLDDIIQVNDQDSFMTARRLAREEGIFAGGSSGSAVYAALKLAKEVGPDKTIVVILTDAGKSYISKFYSDEWMADNGFIMRPSAEGTVSDLLRGKADKTVYSAHVGQRVGDVIAALKSKGVSQMPVLDTKKKAIGILHEVDLLDALLAGSVSQNDAVDALIRPIEGVVPTHAPVSRLRDILSQDLVAIVMQRDEIVGLLTKIDLIDYLSSQQRNDR